MSIPPARDSASDSSSLRPPSIPSVSQRCAEGSSRDNRRESLGLVSDVDAASLCSSPSSMKVRLRNTFLDFKEDSELRLPDIDSPRADSVGGDVAASPLRRTQSDVTGVDMYIRQRLGSNAGHLNDTVEIDGDSAFSPVGRLSPMSNLAHRYKRESHQDGGVSILSFSPPTFQQSPFRADQREESSDFVMVMEEDPPAPKGKIRPPTITTNGHASAVSTQPNTPAPPRTSAIGVDERTTVMLRNIPNKYTQRMLLDEVNTLGFEGEYDFFYLPIDYRNKCNVGYCFISFSKNEIARKFIDQLSGYRLPGFNSQKICEVSWARVQGLKANIQHYRNSPVNSINIPEYRPLLFAHGTEIQFPYVSTRSQ